MLLRLFYYPLNRGCFIFHRQAEIKDVSGNSIEVNTVSPLRSYSPSTLSPAVSILQYDHPVPTTFRPKVYPFTTPSPYDDGFNANSNYLSTGHQIQNPFINPYERSYSYRVPQPAVIVESPNFNDDQLQASSHVRVAPTGFRGYRLANNTVNSKRYSRYRPEIARFDLIVFILGAFNLYTTIVNSIVVNIKAKGINIP